MGLRHLLPDIHLPETIGEDLTPAPSPDPLPVQGAQLPVRQRRALAIGGQRRWWRYVGLDGDLHTVQLGDDVEHIPAVGVLPWVLGFADSRGKGALVAYRENLG